MLQMKEKCQRSISHREEVMASFVPSGGLAMAEIKPYLAGRNRWRLAFGAWRSAVGVWRLACPVGT
jgi:hypothetical protein